MKKGLPLIILLLCGLAFMGFKVRLDNIPRTRVFGSSIIYLPQGTFLKPATLGFSSLAADLVYLWAIQYYSTPEITDRFEYLDHIFSIIFELDPLSLDPYETGAIISVYEAKNIELALQMLEKGYANNPDQWLFPFQAGHYAQYFLKDFERAKRYYSQAAAIEGAPAQTKRLYANALFETTDYQTSWRVWREVYETAEDARTRKIAENHLYRVKSAVDIQNIKEALQTYKDRYGHFPDELDRLVTSGLLPSVPPDFDGKNYLYDPLTGDVGTQAQWMKR
jgi:tetratricopeptide (TPR) repeat protein